MDTFVGRRDPVQAIRDELTGPSSQGRVRILSVSGPGGVGKTFLLDHVLSQLDLQILNFLPLRVDGNTSSVTLADIMVRDLIATSVRPIAGDPQYFSVTRQGWDQLQWMDARARGELEGMAKDDEELALLIGKAYDGVVGLLEFVPHKKAQKAGRIAKRLKGKDLEKLVLVARRASAYKEEKGHLFGLLPMGRAARERNLLRKDLSGRFAEYLTIDLSAILVSGHRPPGWDGSLPPKVKGLDRCLVVLDDYEALEPTLDNFLRQELLPRLAKQHFETVIIIVGRDSVLDVDFAWDQYFGKHIVQDIRLAPLTEDESRQYLSAQGIDDPKAMDRIIQDSMGLPFLLAAEADCELKGGKSALTLQKFVDRTTRWMTQEQKSWVLALAFLDEINEHSVRCMLPDTDPANVVEWFKREASIRSPDTAKWTMLPIIRSRVQASVQNDSPNHYRIYQERAAKAQPGRMW